MDDEERQVYQERERKAFQAQENLKGCMVLAFMAGMLFMALLLWIAKDQGPIGRFMRHSIGPGDE